MIKIADEQPTGRPRFNQVLGFGAYAGAVVMFGLLAYGIFEQLSLGRPLRSDEGSKLAIIGCAALICLGIGYSSCRKSPEGLQFVLASPKDQPTK